MMVPYSSASRKCNSIAISKHYCTPIFNHSIIININIWFLTMWLVNSTCSQDSSLYTCCSHIPVFSNQSYSRLFGLHSKLSRSGWAC